MHYYLRGTDYKSMYKGQSVRRRLKWWLERRFYAVDETETWSLNHTMIQNLYERVRLFRKVAPRYIVMDQEITVKGKTHTQEEWIDILLILMKQYLKDDFDYDKEGYAISEYTENMIWDIWAKLHPFMWN